MVHSVIVAERKTGAGVERFAPVCGCQQPERAPWTRNGCTGDVVGPPRCERCGRFWRRVDAA